MIAAGRVRPGFTRPRRDGVQHAGMEAPTLYLLHLDPPPAGDGPDGAFALAPGLYLVSSWETRSRLYHRVKHRFRPQRLLVAPLADAPKFHGMAAGALKWVRALGD